MLLPLDRWSCRRVDRRWCEIRTCNHLTSGWIFEIYTFCKSLILDGAKRVLRWPSPSEISAESCDASSATHILGNSLAGLFSDILPTQASRSMLRPPIRRASWVNQRVSSLTMLLAVTIKNSIERRESLSLPKRETLQYDIGTGGLVGIHRDQTLGVLLEDLYLRLPDNSETVQMTEWHGEVTSDCLFDVEGVIGVDVENRQLITHLGSTVAWIEAATGVKRASFTLDFDIKACHVWRSHLLIVSTIHRSPVRNLTLWNLTSNRIDSTLR